MTAERIYRNAERFGVFLEATCVDVTQNRWDKLMAGATRADKRRIHRILVAGGHLSAEDARLYNPYHYYKTKTHLIYVHSSTEHFYRINEGR